MTKRMEGDGPKLGMVLYEYDRVLNSLRRKEITARDTVLDPMFQPMLTITKKYVKLAINCNTVVMATFFHPA
jgi:hypothetical protein